VAQYIYEFIGLAIPMKRLHPRFEEEEQEDEDIEGILIYSTKKEGDDPEDEEDEKIDPRWDILNNLKKNIN
jgi:uncharacterized metal-binding protein YceD (DUF177 family)